MKRQGNLYHKEKEKEKILGIQGLENIGKKMKGGGGIRRVEEGFGIAEYFNKTIAF